MHCINWSLILLLIAGGTAIQAALWLVGIVKVPEACHAVVWGSAGIVTYAEICAKQTQKQKRVNDCLATHLGKALTELEETKSFVEAKGARDGR